MVYEDFDTQIRQMQRERQREEYWRSVHNRVTGESIYTMYKCWCMGYRNGEDKTNAKVFGQYLKEHNIELTFWQRKYLAEKYFGYQYVWNAEKKDWDKKKIKSN